MWFYVLIFLACLVCCAVGWYGRAWRERYVLASVPVEPTAVESVTVEVRCVSCQQPFVAGANVCESCGDELPVDAVRQADGTWACRRCKAKR